MIREGVEIWLDRREFEKLVDWMGSWYPETSEGFETPWRDDDDDRIGPSSRLDDLFDVR